MAGSKAYLNQVSDKLIKKAGIEGMTQVSIPDERSATGYGYALVSDKAVFQSTRKDKTPIEGMSNVNLGAGDEAVRYQIKTADGKFENVKATADALAAQWKASQEAFRAQKDGKQAAAPEAKAPEEKTPANNVYLNGVSEKVVHPLNIEGKNLSKVGVADPTSADGWGNFIVPTKQIFPATKFGSDEKIPGKVNVNLGDADKKITYQIKGEDGKYQNVTKTAGEIADAYKVAHDEYMKGVRESAKQAEAPAEAKGLEAEGEMTEVGL